MWIFYALTAAFGDSLRDSSTKKFSSGVPRILVAWAYSLFAIPFMLPLLLSHETAHFSPYLWLLLFCVSSLHAIGGLIVVNVLADGDLSLSLPLSAFTPVFILILSPIFTEDPITFIGIMGCLLVVLGSYVLNISEIKQGWFAPIRALTKEPSARGMLFMSILWSITGSIDRIALRSTSIEFWGALQLIAITVIFLPVVIASGSLRELFKPSYSLRLLVIGGANALSFYPYLHALSLASAHYVICIKRTGILFSILIGRYLFKELHVQERLLGAAIMLLGVIVISFWA